MQIYQSRWGYHPCEHATYRLLKRLLAHFEKARRRLAEWKRWNRKMPHNRVIRRAIRDAMGRKIGSKVIGPRPEPLLCPVFINRTLVVRHGVRGQLTIERICLNYADLPEVLRAARKPQPNPQLVERLRYSREEICRLLTEAEEWEALAK